MNTENEIYENLEPGYSFIFDIARNMPYSVPNGYFKNFEINLRDTIQNIDNDEIHMNWGKSNPYQVPQGYFENFYDRFLDTLLNENESVRFNNADIMEVPASYFAEFPSNMLTVAKESQKRTARIVPLKHHNIWKTLRMAAAAILVLGIGMGLFETGLNYERRTNPENMLTTIPKNELNEYLQQNSLDTDTELTAINNDDYTFKFDNKDIVQYLNENGWDGVE